MRFDAHTAPRTNNAANVTIPIPILLDDRSPPRDASTSAARPARWEKKGRKGKVTEEERNPLIRKVRSAAPRRFTRRTDLWVTIQDHGARTRRPLLLAARVPPSSEPDDPR